MNKVKFLKNLKDTKFENRVEQLKINKSTIIFKVNIVKLVHKYLKMLTSSVTLNFLKSRYKDKDYQYQYGSKQVINK